MARVLMVSDSLDIGGAERHVIGLACALRRRGHVVEIACSAAGPRAAEAEAAQVPIHVAAKALVKRRVCDVSDGLAFIATLDVLVVSSVANEGIQRHSRPPAEAAALADAVCELVANPASAARLADAAQRGVHRDFDAERVVTAMEAVCESVLAGATNHERRSFADAIEG